MLISLQLSEPILIIKLAAAGAINPTMASRVRATRLFTVIKYELILVIRPDTNMVIYEDYGRPNVQL